MDIIFYLSIILLIVFLLSGLAIIAKGFVYQSDDDHFISIMLVSGFFGTILLCLAKASNFGIEAMAYMSLSLGVLALVSAFVSNIINKSESNGYFWFLALF
jgi:peptidoglycan/LPS O-acetylase OafA/YrhL